MGGGLGLAPIERMLRALKTVRAPLAAVVIAGRNARIGRRLTPDRRSCRFPLAGAAFRGKCLRLYARRRRTRHKPGGLTTCRSAGGAASAGLCKPLPGQEERNARVLVEAGPRCARAGSKNLPQRLSRCSRIVRVAGDGGCSRAACDAERRNRSSRDDRAARSDRKEIVA